MSGTGTAVLPAPIIYARRTIIIDTRSSHARGRGNKHRPADEREHAGGGRAKSLNELNGLNDDRN